MRAKSTVNQKGRLLRRPYFFDPAAAPAGIDQVQSKNINPPKPAHESFNDVNQAQQEKEKLINETKRNYNKVTPVCAEYLIRGAEVRESPKIKR